jgi:hypothetical protein
MAKSKRLIVLNKRLYIKFYEKVCNINKIPIYYNFITIESIMYMMFFVHYNMLLNLINSYYKINFIF